MFISRKNIRLTRIRLAALLALSLIIALASINARLITGAKAQDQVEQAGQISITPSFSADKAVTPDQRIEFTLSRAVNSKEGRLALMLGATDITRLIISSETKLTYIPKTIPLPLGDSEITIYLISSTNEWKEIARFPLRVSNEPEAKPATEATEKAAEEKAKEDTEKPAETKEKSEEEKAKESTEKTAESKEAESQEKSSEVKTEEQPAKTEEKTEAAAAEETKKEGEQTETKSQDQSADSSTSAQPQAKRFGFEKLDFVPAITVTVVSQAFQSSFPEANRPARPTFTDANMTASFKTEMTRGFFNSQQQFDFVGASFQEQALRFGELQNRAPQVDLSSYLLQMQIGKAKYLLGHTSFGTLRHLINGHSSRGMTFSIPITSRLDFSVAAMNGTTIVGYDNFFGLDKRRHQLFSGMLGFELLPKRPGGLRFETGVMEGWLEPVTDFTQGEINDAERSRGFGARLIATNPSQRFRFEGGYTRSQFFNPADVLLDQGQNTVLSEALWRNAYFIEAAVDILKEVTVTKTKKANLTFAIKTELVDPLFKSLGASAQADKLSYDYSINGSIGEITAQYGHQRLEDNLADVPSILKSLTRGNAFNISIPLASLFGNPEKPSPLLPRTAYTYGRTYQFGAAIPVNGGFEVDLASIPDQIGTNHAITSDWQINKWRFQYRINQSFQNNRQKGSELNDLSNLANGVTVGVSPSAKLDLNFDFNIESTFDKLAQATNRTQRVAPNFNWRITEKSVLGANVSFTLAGDAAETKRNKNAEFDIQFSQQFGYEKDRFRKFAGQFSIRYANQYARSRDFLLNLNDLTRNQTLNMQVSFTFF
jgi:hypothetical protein